MIGTAAHTIPPCCAQRGTSMAGLQAQAQVGCLTKTTHTRMAAHPHPHAIFFAHLNNQVAEYDASSRADAGRKRIREAVCA